MGGGEPAHLQLVRPVRPEGPQRLPALRAPDGCARAVLRRFMSSRRAALVLTCAALSGGVLGACGGGDNKVDSVPKSTPDLTVPRDATALAPASTTSTTSTTGTTTTPTTTGTTTSVAPTTTSSTQAAPTGGTPSGGTTTPSQTTTSNSGGTPAGGFSDFCKQNPGACGQ